MALSVLVNCDSRTARNGRVAHCSKPKCSPSCALNRGHEWSWSELGRRCLSFDATAVKCPRSQSSSLVSAKKTPWPRQKANGVWWRGPIKNTSPWPLMILMALVWSDLLNFLMTSWRSWILDCLTLFLTLFHFVLICFQCSVTLFIWSSGGIWIQTLCCARKVRNILPRRQGTNLSGWAPSKIVRNTGARRRRRKLISQGAILTARKGPKPLA